MQLLICTRISESKIRLELVPLVKNQQDVSPAQSWSSRFSWQEVIQEWTHSALNSTGADADGSLSLPHVNTVIPMFSCQLIQATENLKGFIMAMGEIFSSFLQIFDSLSIFGVLGFIAKRLAFQCYFRNNEGKRKRETQPLLSPFTVIQAELSTHGSVLFSPLWAPVQKGNARVHVQDRVQQGSQGSLFS